MRNFFSIAFMEPIAVIKGRVVHGKGLGKTVGMPTANLEASAGEVPGAGVYASRVFLRGSEYIGVTNIGPRPTVDDSPRYTIETNILSFDDDIYGETIMLSIEAFLRPVRKMGSLEEVKEQVEKDREEAVRLLSGTSFR